jgi:hypothetical protein
MPAKYASPALVLGQREYANGARLREHLDHQHSRLHRVAGKVSLEPVLVARSAAYTRSDSLTRLQLDDLVYEHERVAVRDYFLYSSVHNYVHTKRQSFRKAPCRYARRAARCLFYAHHALAVFDRRAVFNGVNFGDRAVELARYSRSSASSTRR